MAKPLAAFVMIVTALLAIACSSSPVSSEQADRDLEPTSGREPEPAAEPSDEEPADEPSERGSRAADAFGTDPDDGDTTTGDDDSAGGETADESDAAPSANLATQSTQPTPPAGAATTVPARSPQATPVSGASTQAAPTPEPTTAPQAVFVPPAPTGPVPSDDIAVDGPKVDESEPTELSERGAEACSLTERAIEFLDAGDTTQLASTLRRAAEAAQKAAEPEIASAQSLLRAAGPDEEAAFEAIVVTLEACALHGYQV